MAPKGKTSDSTSEVKRKRHTFTLDAKHKIIKFYEEEMKTREIASKMNLDHTTVGTIIKDKQLILAEVKKACPINKVMIRNGHSLVFEIESLLIICCENQGLIKSCPIHQNTISNEAKLIFEKLKEKYHGTSAEFLSSLVMGGFINSNNGEISIAVQYLKRQQEQ